MVYFVVLLCSYISQSAESCQCHSHSLKDKFESLKMEKTTEAMAQKSGDASDQMTSLQCFNSNDIIKPDQYDMEPGTLHKQNELFVRYMMNFLASGGHLDHSSKDGYSFFF